MSGRLVGVMILIAAVGTLAASSAAAAPLLQSIPSGGVVALSGTPHLWVSEGGTLHWAGDTRALSGKNVQWSERTELSLLELRRYPIGEPWLSSGLVKMGDPIYLSKWEASETEPILFHIQSIDDVDLFGINVSNYGRFVLDQEEWGRRYRFTPSSLRRDRLASAAPVPSVTPKPTSTPQTLPWSAYGSVYGPAAWATCMEVRRQAIDMKRTLAEEERATGVSKTLMGYASGRTAEQQLALEKLIREQAKPGETSGQTIRRLNGFPLSIDIDVPNCS